VFGAGSTQAAAACHGLALVCRYIGAFEEAERLYRDALAVATTGGDDRFAATICHNLGGPHARGRPSDGERWARDGLRLRERADPDPVALAEDRGALAALLLDLDRHTEAAALLAQARAAFVHHLGDAHYEVAVVDGNLAATALARGDLPAAEAHASRALAGKQAHLGPDHPELAPTLTTLGTIRRRQGAIAEAVALHRRAIDVLQPAVTADHPLLATIHANLDTARGDTNTDGPGSRS
jgi:tetratricopeptide (TPR) repeat protein